MANTQRSRDNMYVCREYTWKEEYDEIMKKKRTKKDKHPRR